jgi:hypothetical protein
MSYFIFLKYLDSVEDFRKNPHTKSILNLLVQISKALVYSKIQFLIRKDFFLQLSAQSAQGPADPSGLLAHTAQPAVFFLLPHQSQAHKLPPPADLAPPP